LHSLGTEAVRKSERGPRMVGLRIHQTSAGVADTQTVQMPEALPTGLVEVRDSPMVVHLERGAAVMGVGTGEACQGSGREAAGSTEAREAVAGAS
jgi:hypothetical protein